MYSLFSPFLLHVCCYFFYSVLALILPLCLLFLGLLPLQLHLVKMDNFMWLHVIFLCETLKANVTLVLFLSCMYSIMSLHRIFVVELLRANWAWHFPSQGTQRIWTWKTWKESFQSEIIRTEMFGTFHLYHISQILYFGIPLSTSKLLHNKFSVFIILSKRNFKLTFSGQM